MKLTDVVSKDAAFTKMVKGGIVFGLAFSLSGCGLFFGDEGVFRNRENDYLKADSLPPLVLPANANKEALGELYPIPPISASDFGYDATASAFDVPRPMPLSANMLQDHVKIQRVGENTWILVSAAPGELWPRIRNFMNTNSLTVSKADFKQGIIETGWLQFKTDPDTQNKYRLQIDQGIQPETSEIHITHLSLPAGAKPLTDPDWPTKSVNPEREKWLLDELAATLASEATEGGGTSMLAQGIGGSTAAKATLGMYKNDPVMRLKLDKTRTMATLAFAAKKDGFQLLDSDSEAGLFHVYYINSEDAKPGWFKRFFHIGLKPKTIKSKYSLAQLQANMLRGDAFENAPYSDIGEEKVLKDAQGYLVVVTGQPGDYLVRVRDPYGKRLKPKEARELITVLRKNLI